jgi:hypothetical protein
VVADLDRRAASIRRAQKATTEDDAVAISNARPIDSTFPAPARLVDDASGAVAAIRFSLIFASFTTVTSDYRCTTKRQGSTFYTAAARIP